MYFVSTFLCNNEQNKSGLCWCRGSWEPTGPRSGDCSDVFPLRCYDYYQATASTTTVCSLKQQDPGEGEQGLSVLIRPFLIKHMEPGDRFYDRRTSLHYYFKPHDQCKPQSQVLLSVKLRWG